MIQFKQNSTSYDLAFILYDSTDHITPKTGLTPTVQISKNGATTFSTATGTVSEIGNGFYRWAPASGDVDTLGRLAIRVTATGADPLAMIAQVVAYDPYDSSSLGLSYLQALILGSGQVVSDTENTNQQFKTNLSGSAAHFRGMFIRFVSGNNANEMRWINSFTESTSFVEVNSGFSSIPAAGDSFVLIGYAGR